MTSTATNAQVKQLRSDARKLTLIAKHLRQHATDLLAADKMAEKAEEKSKKFFARKSEILGGGIEPLNDPLFPEVK